MSRGLWYLKKTNVKNCKHVFVPPKKFGLGTSKIVGTSKNFGCHQKFGGGELLEIYFLKAIYNNLMLPSHQNNFFLKMFKTTITISKMSQSFNLMIFLCRRSDRRKSRMHL
jgi:hypothetical protein